MAKKMKVLESIILHRPTGEKDDDGKAVIGRFEPPVGKAFKFTSKEIAELQKINPNAFEEIEGEEHEDDDDDDAPNAGGNDGGTGDKRNDASQASNTGTRKAQAGKGPAKDDTGAAGNGTGKAEDDKL